MSEQRGEHSSTINNKEEMRSALVAALFQLDPLKTFHLDTTPEEQLLFEASLQGDVARMELLLSDPSLLSLALTEKPRPYGLTQLSLFNLRIMNVIAATSGQADIVEYLLAIAQRENIIQNFFIDRDTINAALSSDNVEVFRKLIDVDPSCVNNSLSHGGYPLNQAISRYTRAPGNTLATVRLFLESGANPNASFTYFRSFGANLSNAARNGYVEIVRLLLEHGAYVVDSGAIQAAVSESRIEVLDLLLEQGADVNERPRLCLKKVGRSRPEEEAERASETLLHVAVRENQPLAAKWLLDHGADVSLRDWKANTPLEAAVASNKVEMMEVLSEHLARDEKI